MYVYVFIVDLNPVEFEVSIMCYLHNIYTHLALVYIPMYVYIYVIYIIYHS